MMWGVWYSSVDGCDEGWLGFQGGNGRVHRAEFSLEEDAEACAFREGAADPETAFFAAPLNLQGVAFRAEWLAARERVRVRLKARYNVEDDE